MAPHDPDQRRRTVEALESVRRQLERTQRTLDEFVTRLSEDDADGASGRDSNAA